MLNVIDTCRKSPSGRPERYTFPRVRPNDEDPKPCNATAVAPSWACTSRAPPRMASTPNRIAGARQLDQVARIMDRSRGEEGWSSRAFYVFDAGTRCIDSQIGAFRAPASAIAIK